jgi:hypothetical protein
VRNWKDIKLKNFALYDYLIVSLIVSSNKTIGRNIKVSKRGNMTAGKPNLFLKVFHANTQHGI